MPADRVTAKPSQPLSMRQEEILALILEGYTNREICDTLGITERTRRAHTSTLMRKFGVKRSRFLIPAAHRYYSKMPMVPRKRRVE